MAARLRVERLVLQAVAKERMDGKEITRVSQELLDSFHRLLAEHEHRKLGGQTQVQTQTQSRTQMQSRRRGGCENWLAHLRTLEGYIPALGERRFVACGSALGQTAHSLLVDAEGGVWGFGPQNDDGRLGLGDPFARLSPHRIPPHLIPPIASVACGGMSRSALGWGGGEGDARSVNRRLSSSCLNSSAQVDLTPRGENLAVKHAGFSVAVSRDGQVFAWGDSAHGCLGLGHVQMSFVPRAIPALSKYVVHRVAAGGAHCLAITKGGGGGAGVWGGAGSSRVFGWGLGKFGQLGTGTRTRHMVPVEIEGIHILNIYIHVCMHTHTHTHMHIYM
jgi:alpha-tubulin suppressor-like RCC1 family protein